MDRKRIRHRLSHQTITEAAIITAVLAFLSKVVGYVRDMLTAKYFGTSMQMDAFEVALIIPNMILGLFAAGLQTIIVRMYSEKKEESREKGKVFVNQLFFIYSIFLFIITILIIVFSPAAVKIVAAGFTSDRLNYASTFVKMLAIFGYLNVMTGFFTGVFQAEKQFFYPALVGLIANIAVPICLIVFTPSIGIYSRVIGQDMFGIIFFLMLFIFLYSRWGFFKRFNIRNIDWSSIREFTNLVMPAIAVSSLNILYQIIDKTIGSYLPYGAIASLSYAQTVYLIPYSLIGTSITTAVYPTLSEHVVSNNSENFLRLFKKSFYLLVFVMVPITVYFTVWARPIVRVLFERGAFSTSSTLLTQKNVIMYSLGLLGIALSDLFRRAFFSFKDTKTLMRISWVSVALNLVLDIVLAKLLASPGIALATTIVTYVSLIQYFLYSRSKHYFTAGYLGKILKETLKAVVPGVIISILAYFSLRIIPVQAHAIKIFLISIGIGAILFIIYVSLGKLLKGEIFDVALSYMGDFKKRFLGGKK